MEEAVDDTMIAPISKETLNHVFSWVPGNLLSLKQAKADFLEEMSDDYIFATKKGMLDYVLLDPKEQERLGVPVPYKVNSLITLMLSAVMLTREKKSKIWYGI